MNVQDWVSIDLPVNWKLAMEAFMEGYHRAQTHPQLQAASTAASANQYGAPPSSAPRARKPLSGPDAVAASVEYLKTLGEGMGGMIHATDVAVGRSLVDREWPEDEGAALKEFYDLFNSEITKRARERGIPMPDFTDPKIMVAPVEYVFPNYFMLIQFGNMSSYRIRPTGPESCLFELWSLSLYPEGKHTEQMAEPKPVAYNDPSLPLIPSQDYDNLPFQQEGLHADGFEYMRLSKEVEGLISNYHRLIDGYLDGADRKQLACACGIVSSPLDTPIRDIGV